MLRDNTVYRDMSLIKGMTVLYFPLIYYEKFY
jgi:hypothetical protein